MKPYPLEDDLREPDPAGGHAARAAPGGVGEHDARGRPGQRTDIANFEFRIVNCEFRIADWRARNCRHSLWAELRDPRRSARRVVGTTAIVARYFPAEWRKRLERRDG